ncbi:MAG: class I SAM-dependent methyltransferase [Nitrospirae bacterium]|nr:class I SAM-dependent methyltransferase [Nitrospirota bacterium]
MPDNSDITKNLLDMYGRNDWVMNLNFRFFLSFSGLKDLPLDSKILDCGCAMGHLIIMLKSFGFNNVSGLDASPEMVESAKKITGSPVILSDVVEIRRHFEPECLDAIIISDLFHHIPSMDAWEIILDGCSTILRENGCLIIREPYPIFLLNLLYKMSRYKFLHFGFLKARLRSFIEEDELLKYFFTHWPNGYRDLLSKNGFRIIKDMDWLVHRITSCRRIAHSR